MCHEFAEKLKDAGECWCIMIFLNNVHSSSTRIFNPCTKIIICEQMTELNLYYYRGSILSMVRWGQDSIGYISQEMATSKANNILLGDT
jgi:hypothetical protein